MFHLMDIQRRLANHNQRWNLDSSPEEQFTKFKNRAISATNDVIGQLLVERSEIDNAFKQIFQQYCANAPYVKTSKRITNLDQVQVHMSMAGLSSSYLFKTIEVTEKGFGDTHVYNELKKTNNLAELITILQIVFWVIEEEVDQSTYQNELIKRLRDEAKLTPLMKFYASVKRKAVVFYPPGEEFLDRGVLDYVISGLEKYPDVAKHFEQALAFYQTGDVSAYRNLLDNLRFALEQLLKKILKNNKSIENQKDVLLPWLKQKGINSSLVNTYILLISHYMKYQNNAVKHNESFSQNEIEFVIYLTGTFMRLILQLADESLTNGSP